MIRKRYEELPPADPSILADMLASRQAPGTKWTDRTFLQGRLTGHSLDRMDPVTRAKWLKVAKKKGFSLNGKVLCSGLTNQEFDLRAWVDSRAEQKERCAALGRNLWVNGDCVYSAPELPPKPKVNLAASIVEKEVNSLLKKDPSLRKKKRQELREAVIDKHGKPDSWRKG